MMNGWRSPKLTEQMNGFGRSAKPSKPNSRRRTMDDGYYCVICGRYIEAVDGVVVHDNVPHPDMAFDDEERPQ
tara:strand:+ start:775 stop:993 length:219 start_codon:yes stop_codon:yes gene_type:complete